jgi:holliday junction DNA helicase RuvA
MISCVKGTVIHKDSESLVVMMGGVGIEIVTSRTALEQTQVDADVLIWTRLIVREDSLTLFGFSSPAEREFFDSLIKINGVGPKLAIAILSTLSIENLRSAIANDRPEIITRVPGIGKKTAQKIILDLKDKIRPGLDTVPIVEFADVDQDVMDALIGLGFSVVEAQSAIQSIPIDAPREVNERVRIALQYLSS